MSEGMVQYIMLCKLLLLDKDINEKYRWLGMDSSGEVIAYVIRPTLFKDSNFGDKSVDHEDDMWFCGDIGKPTHPDTTERYIDVGFIQNPSIIDWKESVITVKEVLEYE